MRSGDGPVLESGPMSTLLDGPMDAGWMDRARPLDEILVDAALCISDSVYHGPVNGFSREEWGSLREPVEPPDLPCRVPGVVVTDDARGREDALAAYYERLVDVARRCGASVALARPFPYFRVTPVVVAAGEQVVSFDWTDDVAETSHILRALAGAGDDGVVWDDVDEGWFIYVVVQDGVLFIGQFDPDRPREELVLRADARVVAEQAAAALDRLTRLHAHLVESLGHDYWTSRH